MRVLKILHVVSGDLWAGAEVMADSLIGELARDPGFDVRVVLLNDGELASRLRARGVSVHVLNESSMGTLRIFYRLYRISSEFGPMIVHTHRQKENVLGALVAALIRAKSIRTVHGWTEFPKLGFRLDKHAFRALDTLCAKWLQKPIVAVSAELKTKLSARFDSSKIVVAENGIDIEAVRNAASRGPAIHIDPGKQSFAMIARLVPVKRHDRFIEAAEILLREYPRRFEFHIIGDGALAPPLKARVEQDGFSNDIHFHGFRDDIPAILSSLNGIVICSDHEGLPMNALEAAIFGTPIITTPLPSIEELLRHGVSGVVCADAEPQSIAQAICASCELPKGHEQPIDSNWTYSDRSMANRYKELYRTMLGSWAA